MNRSMKRSHVALLVSAILGVSFAVPCGYAQGWDNGGADSDWSTPENWIGDAEPTSVTSPQIGRTGGAYDPNAYVVVTQSGEVAGHVLMGFAGATGTLEILSGDLTVNRFLIGYQVGGIGHVIQRNGTVTVLDATMFRLGNVSGGVGTYVLEGGTLDLAHDAIAAHLGTGTMELRGGTLELNSSDITVGGAAGAVGELVIEAGATINNLNALYVGDAGDGLVTHNGGSHVIPFTQVARSGGTGAYNLVGGTLQFGTLVLDDGTARFEQASGTTVIVTGALRIGDSNASTCDALYTIRGGTLDCQTHLAMPYIASARSELQGWGTVTVKNTHRLEIRGANGYVTASGFGVDQELDLDYGILYDVDGDDPTTSNGWYAVDHGKLTLPDVTVDAATEFWGEDTNASAPNRANSVKLEFAGRSGSGTLTGSLLAADHGDVPASAGTVDLAGVWGLGFSGFTFTSVDLTFRYDASAVAALGLAESDLVVYQSSGGAWQELAVTRDEANNRITASGVSALGYFAVGRIVPPTCVGITCAELRVLALGEVCSAGVSPTSLDGLRDLIDAKVAEALDGADYCDDTIALTDCVEQMLLDTGLSP